MELPGVQVALDLSEEQSLDVKKGNALQTMAIKEFVFDSEREASILK